MTETEKRLFIVPSCLQVGFFYFMQIERTTNETKDFTWSNRFNSRL